MLDGDGPTLGVLLEQARTRRGLLKRQVAREVLGSADRYREISRWEDDLHEPGDKNLARLAAFYEIPIAELRRAAATRRQGLSEINKKLDRILNLLEEKQL